MLLKKMMVQLTIGVFFLSCLSPKKKTESSIDKLSKDSNTSSISDTSKKGVTSKPGLYKDVITKNAVTDTGLFIVHKVNDRFLWEIPLNLLGRDILTVNRISKGAAETRFAGGILGYAGDQIGESVIQFSKGPYNKIYIKRSSWLEISKDSSENGMYHSLQNSSLLPIVGSFNIKAYSPDSSAIVIDVTDYLKEDNDIFFFNKLLKSFISLGSMQADQSYIESITSYPLNIEIKTIKTYLNPNPKAGNLYTFLLNSSMVLLPEKSMKPRYADDRVGYFSRGYRDYDIPQTVKPVYMINRWRLEPAEKDIDKYLRGELVEPKKPIVYYIDPTTPKKWIPYLIRGVNDWQKAFEKAGFKNAIYALEVPKNDSTWNFEDARHNVIVYKPSYVANAMGPHVHDPRSGEILEAHISWYHNVMELLHSWYMIQAGPNDPRARKMVFDDNLMGQLIRFVSSHEVGHTLGLLHNFGASSTVPVDSLRNKHWVEKNGFCPSIMDYARFNYVAQPEDNISEKGIFPRIGIYDEWAIEWGYRWFPNTKTREEEKQFMDQWISHKLDSDKRLWFGSELAQLDPRCQSEDIGDDAARAGYYGIKNLKRVMSNIAEWSKVDNEGYESLAKMRDQIVMQYQRYIFHVATNIGGVMFTPKTVGQGGVLLEFTNREKQKAAVKFLQDELFTTPDWISDRKIFSLVGGTGPYAPLELQRAILRNIMSLVNYTFLLHAQVQDPANCYTYEELLNDLKAGIWKELKAGNQIDIYRRNLQKAYTERLIQCLNFQTSELGVEVGLFGPTNIRTDAFSLIKGHIKQLLAEIEKAIPLYRDGVEKLHLTDVKERLKDALNTDKNKTASVAAPEQKTSFNIATYLEGLKCADGPVMLLKPGMEQGRNQHVCDFCK